MVIVHQYRFSNTTELGRNCLLRCIRLSGQVSERLLLRRFDLAVQYSFFKLARQNTRLGISRQRNILAFEIDYQEVSRSGQLGEPCLCKRRDTCFSPSFAITQSSFALKRNF